MTVLLSASRFLKLLTFLFLVVSIFLVNDQVSVVDRIYGNIKNYNFTHFFGMMFALMAVMLIDFFLLGWDASALKKIIIPDRSVKADVVIMMLKIFGYINVILVFLTFGEINFIRELIDSYFGFSFLLDVPSAVLHVIIYMVIYDFLEYCYHRLLHKVKFLWVIHKYHHAMTSFVIFTREHPIEDILKVVFTAIPIALVGAPVESFLFVSVVSQVLGGLRHSMVNVTYGWVGRWIICSPVYHRIHHSPCEEHWNKNFGSIFVIWDRLFGTFYSGDKVNKEVGVSNNIYHKNSLAWDVNTCFFLFFNSLWESFSNKSWLVGKKH